MDAQKAERASSLLSEMKQLGNIINGKPRDLIVLTDGNESDSIKVEPNSEIHNAIIDALQRKRNGLARELDKL